MRCQLLMTTRPIVSFCLFSGRTFFFHQVQDSKTTPLRYKLTRDFTRNYFKATVLTSFPELEGEVRARFFSQYIRRVKEKTPPQVNLHLFISCKYRCKHFGEAKSASVFSNLKIRVCESEVGTCGTAAFNAFSIFLHTKMHTALFRYPK